MITIGRPSKASNLFHNSLISQGTINITLSAILCLKLNPNLTSYTMHLKSIQINDFRALKDIQIDFEPEFPRRIFPLGSLNGGGKSTLLQLVFTLLHCSASQEPEKLDFIKNLLARFQVEADVLKELASFTIVDNEADADKQKKLTKAYCLRFYICHDTYIKTLLSSSVDDPSSDTLLRFSSVIDLQNNGNKITNLQSEIKTLEKGIDQIEKSKLIDDPSERLMRIRRELQELGLESIPSIRRARSVPTSRYLRNTPPEEIQGELQELLEIAQVNLATAHSKSKVLSSNTEVINRCLQEEGLNYVTNYAGNQENDSALLYRIDGLEGQNASDLVKAIAEKVFLAAPSTQIYLFLSERERRSIFKTKNSQGSPYFQVLEEAKAQFGTFLSTYDFFETRFLIDLFTQARDEDFRCATESQGNYGDNYKRLVEEMNWILPGKTINVKVNGKGQISEVTFTLTTGSEERSLLPEDLSHGELKKLNLYTWLKTYQIKDAIVLMDEPEIALHPDWQYTLTNNLWEWEPSNQYILATHSYEICQPLTPYHIKEIEPKLLKDEKQN